MRRGKGAENTLLMASSEVSQEASCFAIAFKGLGRLLSSQTTVLITLTESLCANLRYRTSLWKKTKSY